MGMRTGAIFLTVSGLVLAAAAYEQVCAECHRSDQRGTGLFRGFTPALSPEIYQPTGGKASYVFALAEAR